MFAQPISLFHTRDKSPAAKKIALLLLACCLAIFFTACSPADSSTTTSTAEAATEAPAETDANQEEETTAAETERETGFSASDLEIVLDGTNYVLLEDAADLLAVLGEEYDYSEADSCVFEGMDKTFDYGDVLVYTVPSGEIDLLDGYDIYGGGYKTAAGIGIGSTRDEVLEVYGEPADDSDYMVYNESGDPESIDEPRLTLVIDSDGIVEMISYYSGSNAQG